MNRCSLYARCSDIHDFLSFRIVLDSPGELNLIYPFELIEDEDGRRQNEMKDRKATLCSQSSFSKREMPTSICCPHVASATLILFQTYLQFILFKIVVILSIPFFRGTYFSRFHKKKLRIENPWTKISRLLYVLLLGANYLMSLMSIRTHPCMTLRLLSPWENLTHSFSGKSIVRPEVSINISK